MSPFGDGGVAPISRKVYCCSAFNICRLGGITVGCNRERKIRPITRSESTD